MTYQALYRKYRPLVFGDVAGQNHITETLRREVEMNRLSHAYLFVGTRGTGKTSCAKILARAVNCEHPVGGEPCNECDACRAVLSGAATDVAELDAASNNTVDRVRELASEMAYTPSVLKKRVYIFDEAHMLTSAAWNALLQIIEEPPEHLLFIFATTDAHKVPATILSRCQSFHFRRLTPQDIGARLKFVADAERITLTDGANALLSRLADGALRDGLSLLDQCAGSGDVTEEIVRDITGLSSSGDALKLLRHIVSRDAAAAFRVLDETYAEGRVIDALFDEMSQLTRDALVLTLAPREESLLSGSASPDELRNLAKPDRLRYMLGAIEDARRGFTRGSGDRTAAEFAIAEMISEDLDREALAARVSALEEKLAGGTVVVPERVIRDSDTLQKDAFAPDFDDEFGEPPPEFETVYEPKFEPPQRTEPARIAKSEPKTAPKSDDEPKKPIPPAPPLPTLKAVRDDGDARSAEVWRGVMKQLGASKNALLDVMLRDSAASIDGRNVTVRVAGGDFAVGMLSNAQNKDEVRALLESELGGAVTLKFVDAETEIAAAPEISGQASIDDLLKFDIVSEV